MGYKLHDALTPKRLEYLRAVEVGAPYEPRHGVTANHCLCLGWVETVMRRDDGSIVAWHDIPPGEHSVHDTILGQRLTDKGREVLQRAA